MSVGGKGSASACVYVCVCMCMCVCVCACVCVVAMCLSADHFFRALITWCMFTHMVTVAVWILCDAFHLDYRICSGLLCFTVMLLVNTSQSTTSQRSGKPNIPKVLVVGLWSCSRCGQPANPSQCRPTHPIAMPGLLPLQQSTKSDRETKEMLVCKTAL